VAKHERRPQKDELEQLVEVKLANSDQRIRLILLAVLSISYSVILATIVAAG
jgi:hypothetical protein